ncbi:MAG: F0F1 ATP synthase subunit delta [Coxiellaceae bacterium]|nr:F0F1 ATP synthase subunit delta [Coxiellaceae bacterium]
MANHRTIARPYAVALFKQAKADDRLEQWSFVLQGLSLITTDPRMQALYGNPKVTNKVMIELVYDTLLDAAHDAATGLSDKLKNFLSLLMEEKRLSVSTDIDALYHQLLADYKNVVEIEVISAMTLSEAQQQAFYKAMEKRFASKVSIAFQEDESLIGGALVRSGNWVLDGSIRGKVSRLDDALTS